MKTPAMAACLSTSPRRAGPTKGRRCGGPCGQASGRRMRAPGGAGTGPMGWVFAGGMDRVYGVPAAGFVVRGGPAPPPRSPARRLPVCRRRDGRGRDGHRGSSRPAPVAVHKSTVSAAPWSRALRWTLWAGRYMPDGGTRNRLRCAPAFAIMAPSGRQPDGSNPPTDPRVVAGRCGWQDDWVASSRRLPPSQRPVPQPHAGLFFGAGPAEARSSERCPGAGTSVRPVRQQCGQPCLIGPATWQKRPARSR